MAAIYYKAPLLLSQERGRQFHLCYQQGSSAPQALETRLLLNKHLLFYSTLLTSLSSRLLFLVSTGTIPSITLSKQINNGFISQFKEIFTEFQLDVLGGGTACHREKREKCWSKGILKYSVQPSFFRPPQKAFLMSLSSTTSNAATQPFVSEITSSAASYLYLPSRQTPHRPTSQSHTPALHCTRHNRLQVNHLLQSVNDQKQICTTNVIT